MPGDMDNIARNFMTSPQGIKMIRGLDQFNTLLSSENGRQLLAMLSGGGGDALKSAASAASVAPKDRGRALISSLLASKEGAALASKIIELLGV